MQPEYAQARHALAGAGLAHDPERSTALEGEGHPIDGLHQAVVGREVDLQALDLKHRARGGPAPEHRLGGGRAEVAGRRHASLTLGSTTAYKMSTTTLAMTTKNVASKVTPMISGRSWLLIAVMVNRPSP